MEFTKGHWLSPDSEFTVKRHGLTFRSATVAYVWERQAPHLPGTRDRWQRATSRQARSWSEGFRPGGDDWVVMQEILRDRFRQHPALAARLRETEGPLFYVDPDPFWGSGRHGLGENWLGFVLVQIREELRR